MSELQYELDEKTGDWRCYDPKLNWITFSGFGRNKEEAKSAFFLHQPRVFSFGSVGLINKFTV